MKKRTLSLFVLVSVALFLSLALGIRASFLQNSLGWIWGGTDTISGGTTGLGWISLNSRDCDTNGDGTVSGGEQVAHPACPAGAIVDFGVDIPDGIDGIVSGYGYSENYGWISFNASDVVGCPSGLCNARRASNKLAGWARVLSIANGGGNAGGWTGFIKLGSDATDTVSYGVAITGRSLSGYAYSDEMGWIDFTSAQILPRDIIQICRDGSATPFMVNGEAPKGLTLGLGDSTDMRVYFDNTQDCAGVDVTSLGGLNITNTTPAVISISGANPKTLSGIATIPAASNSGQQSGTSTVTFTYSGQSVVVNFTVMEICTTTCPASQADHCSNEPAYATQNSCQQAEMCGGTRYCDFNYKEVAP